MLRFAIWPLLVALAATGCRDPIAGPARATRDTAPRLALDGVVSEEWQLSVIAHPLCTEMQANALNDGDVVVGVCVGAGPPVAYRWQSGVMTTIPAVAGGSSSLASAVNASGNVVGEIAVSLRGRAFFWSAQGVVTVLPTLGDSRTRSERAHAINGSNDVVGVSCCPDVAVLWHYANGAWSAASLGTIGGSGDRATGINDAGVVVGYSDDAGGVIRAWRRPPGGVLEILGTPDKPAAMAAASDVNNAGTIVGDWDYGTFRDYFRWQASTGITHAGITGGTYLRGHPYGISISERHRLGITLAGEVPFTMRGNGVALLPLPVGVKRGSVTDVNTCGTTVGFTAPTRTALLWRRYERGRPVCD